MRQRTPRTIEPFPGANVLRPRSMLFTLYGDYAYPRGVDLWLGSLVSIGARLGISEAALRSAVARLARDGWLISKRRGSRSYYALSDRGVALIEEGTARIYEPRSEPWDGTWCVLTYAIPESRRAHRDRLRKQLAWLGFGALGGGTYMSPRSVGARTAALVQEHGVSEFARIFSARFQGPIKANEMVRRCWNLSAIARQYARFSARYTPFFNIDRKRDRDGSLDDATAFVRRFALTHDFRHFPFIDPDLPRELLPKGWAGARARDLFERYHALLTNSALRYFSEVATLSANAINGRSRSASVRARIPRSDGTRRR